MEVRGSLKKHWRQRGALSTRHQLDKCGMTIKSSTWSLWVILQEQTFRFFNIAVQGLYNYNKIDFSYNYVEPNCCCMPRPHQTDWLIIMNSAAFEGYNTFAAFQLLLLDNNCFSHLRVKPFGSTELGSHLLVSPKEKNSTVALQWILDIQNVLVKCVWKSIFTFLLDKYKEAFGLKFEYLSYLNLRNKHMIAFTQHPCL